MQNHFRYVAFRATPSELCGPSQKWLRKKITSYYLRSVFGWKLSFFGRVTAYYIEYNVRYTYCTGCPSTFYERKITLVIFQFVCIFFFHSVGRMFREKLHFYFRPLITEKQTYTFLFFTLQSFRNNHFQKDIGLNILILSYTNIWQIISVFDILISKVGVCKPAYCKTSYRLPVLLHCITILILYGVIR